VTKPKSVFELISEHRSLIEDIATGRAALFVGAGLSQGAGLPGWSGLIAALDRRLDTGLGGIQAGVLDKAQRMDRLVGRARLGRALAEILSEHAGPTDVQKALVALPFSAIFTTNYDHLLEDALEAVGKQHDAIRYDEEVGVLDPAVALPVVKFHGDLEDPPGIVLTASDYRQYGQLHPAFIPLLEAQLATRTFLFVGFGLTDPNFVAIDATVRRALGRYRRQAYAVVVDSPGAPVEVGPHLRLLRVALDEVDDLLVGLAEAARALAPSPGRAVDPSALQTVREAICAEIRGLPKALIASPAQIPERPSSASPSTWEGSVERVVGLLADADAFGVDDDDCWTALANALLRCGLEVSALRALGHIGRLGPEARRTAAWCHWRRGEIWRTRRILEPLVYGGPGGAADLELLDRWPTVAAMYAYACNEEAEEHLARGRWDRAAAVATRGLEPLSAWLDDATTPTHIPGWMWVYFYNHQGRAHTLLIQAGQPPADHLRRAERALRQSIARPQTLTRAWVNLYDLYRTVGDEAKQRALLAELEGAGKIKALREIRLRWPPER
jgi:hypothetical protein